MRILGFDVARRSKNTPGNIEERGSLEDYLSYYGIPFSNNGTKVNYDTAMNISAVYKAVNLISDSIASLPLEPYTLQGDTFKVDKNHPSYKLLNVEPHPTYGKFNFWKLLVANMLLHGNGYAYIHRDEYGNPINLIPFYPPDVEVYINEKEQELKYKIIDRPGFIEQSDMIHIINYSKNGYYGIGTVIYGSRSLGIAIAGDKNAYGFFSNGSNMSGIITVDGRLTREKAEGIKTNWNESFSPFNDNSTPGGIAVMEKGMEYTSVSVDPQSAQLLESRKWNVEEVARWFNLPASKLGIQSGQYYNSIEQNNLEYLQTTLTPILDKIENELERKLFRPSVRSTTVAKFNEDATMRADLDSKINYLSKCIDSGLMSINEGRSKLGLEPVNEGDTIIVKSGNQPLSKLLHEPEQKSVSRNVKQQQRTNKEKTDGKRN